jgi:hypothetical protein
MLRYKLKAFENQTAKLALVLWRAYIFLHIYTYTSKCAYIYIFIYTLIYTYIHTYTYIYVHSHTYTYTKIYTYRGALNRSFRAPNSQIDDNNINYLLN